MNKIKYKANENKTIKNVQKKKTQKHLTLSVGQLLLGTVLTLKYVETPNDIPLGKIYFPLAKKVSVANSFLGRSRTRRSLPPSARLAGRDKTFRP